MALLQRAQELRLANRAGGAPRGGGEGLAVPEGVAWQKCFASFFTLLHRHLQTLSDVYRLAQDVRLSLFPLVCMPSRYLSLIHVFIAHAE